MKNTFVKQAAIGTIWPLLVYGGLALFLANSNPRKLPLILIVIPFGLIFVGLYLPLKAFAMSFARGFKGRDLRLETTKRLRLIALLTAAVPTFLLILSSINQLTIKDFLLSFILLGGLVFYVNRSRLLSR